MIVEDDFIIADEIALIVKDAGYSVIGPIASIEAAEAQLTAAERPDFAVVDANLRETSSAALAQTMRGLGIPFCLCTGYRSDDLGEFGDIVVLQKPVDARHLVSTIDAALRAQDEAISPGSPQSGSADD